VVIERLLTAAIPGNEKLQCHENNKKGTASASRFSFITGKKLVRKNALLLLLRV
jgi:hypothetical protein